MSGPNPRGQNCAHTYGPACAVVPQQRRAQAGLEATRPRADTVARRRRRLRLDAPGDTHFGTSRSSEREASVPCHMHGATHAQAHAIQQPACHLAAAAACSHMHGATHARARAIQQPACHLAAAAACSHMHGATHARARAIQQSACHLAAAAACSHMMHAPAYVEQRQYTTQSCMHACVRACMRACMHACVHEWPHPTRSACMHLGLDVITALFHPISWICAGA
eukprot:364923-Chlamydomonas_euryale.AAC.3